MGEHEQKELDTSPEQCDRDTRNNSNKGFIQVKEGEYN
jgi:hypothetical protein